MWGGAGGAGGSLAPHRPPSRPLSPIHASRLTPLPPPLVMLPLPDRRDGVCGAMVREDAWLGVRERAGVVGRGCGITAAGARLRVGCHAGTAEGRWDLLGVTGVAVVK